jgi:hypothetical protein
MPLNRFPLVLLVLCSLTTAFFTACCVGRRDINTPLTAEEIAFVPYALESTFSLQDSAGNIQTFSVESYFTNEVIMGCFECCGDYVGQRREFVFKSTVPERTLSLILTHESIAEEEGPYVYLYFAFEGPIIGRIMAFGDDCERWETACQDSVTINGQAYFNVAEVRNVNSNTTPTDLQTLWYNKARGILKYQLNNGEYWELVP